MTDFDAIKSAIRELLATHGLTCKAEFVPYSQSDNAKPGKAGNGLDKPWPSLNWRVTVEKNGRAILTTPYSAGTAHTPASKLPPSRDREVLIAWEIENGYPGAHVRFDHPQGGRGAWTASRKLGSKPLLPDAVDVFSSLALDSDVLDSPRFEDWASELGYDPDSRSAEAIYRTCLEHALALRAAIGEAALRELRDLANEL
jgi:hypothetical protein